MLLASSCKHSSTYIRLTGLAQGSTYLITYSETDEKGVSIAATATEVQELIDAGFERINNSVSGYHQGSTLSRINRNETTQTDSIFRDLFRISQQIWKETDGLFDPSGAPLYDLWGFGFQQRAKISTHQIDSLQKFIGMDKFRLDGEQLIKTNPNARLNFNAIAQGYTCDYIARILDSLHIQNYLIEVGGEVYAKGLNAQERPGALVLTALKTETISRERNCKKLSTSATKDSSPPATTGNSTWKTERSTPTPSTPRPESPYNTTF